MNRLPPYDTGKIKIGAFYEPPRPNYMTPDTEQLQSALLKRAPRFRTMHEQEWRVVVKDSLMWLACCAVLAAMMFAPSILNLFTGA